VLCFTAKNLTAERRSGFATLPGAQRVSESVNRPNGFFLPNNCSVPFIRVVSDLPAEKNSQGWDRYTERMKRWWARSRVVDDDVRNLFALSIVLDVVGMSRTHGVQRAGKAYR